MFVDVYCLDRDFLRRHRPYSSVDLLVVVRRGEETTIDHFQWKRGKEKDSRLSRSRSTVGEETARGNDCAKHWNRMDEDRSSATNSA